ncbi:MAG: phosphatidylserine decarboxylase [Kiloniellales bacterium]
MSALDTLQIRISRDGWPFIAGLALASVLLGVYVIEPLGWLGALLTLWCAYFFRDPDRVTPVRSGLIVSPADGVLRQVERAPPPAELDMAARPLVRLSIFMNIFDVHVNRVPADGSIVKLAYRPGKFFNASFDKASDENERQSVRMALACGRELAFVQIAGLIARRIKCALGPGQTVRAGERFGMIRFGSRVDLYLPEGVAPLVAVGQTMRAGETVLADTLGVANEPAREGELR